ncbi:MAG: endonuclease/exonuclease/phosphatase family protein [Oscillospiraceae bacterium]|nr:endonuclease/exonuclease/phosphatase family protein [Oscillospiraceae bacterium]
MKIMSFNTQHCLNFIEQKIDYQIMADAIKKVNPDIVGLNEMRNSAPASEYDNQAAILSELTELKHHYFPGAIVVNDKYSYGNALLSKLPILSAETTPVPDPESRTEGGTYETRCLLKAKLEGGVTVLVIHFGLNPDEQKNAVETVVENLEDEKCILMGDFNVVPENEVLNPIRARMKDTADCFDKPLLSFPSDNPQRKIDYLFVSPDVEVVSADIPEIVASDHRPHIATVNI